MIAITGVGPGGQDENRALAYLHVEHNGQTYEWQAFVPVGVGLQEFEAWVEPRIYAEIDAKEAEWAALNPKTRDIEDPITGETQTVPIDKSEIVRPDIPDYYARRRGEYPALGDQLDALWKGGLAAETMLAKIQAVKDKYPKS